ncbi:cytochrome ubiquinol oxidase subunit I [Acinetobacter sp. MB5]|uniref:cytochrome ubiquinol oxidase subunit I n=1 Tax=Acinetobacter sp. MB5 TaxID=2069438 RepID=UPI000DCF7A5E|nr:cytochrome ubiquinol oxidase subunit I [Acinetobacter sp. MB5]
MDFGLSAFALARMQFAFTVSFHIIFPATSIGLACFLAVLEWKWLRSRNPLYQDLFKYWLKIFAVAFAMGVVSGIVMAYQFGTNWSEFSRIAGSVTGPLLTYEVLSAFFLEAGFLGIMMFGWGRVSEKAHFFATLMVAIGTCISMFWILSSNSWMQTPQGIALEHGILVPKDWWAIVFNPSFPYRFAHMGIAAFLVSGLLVTGSSAWHLLKGRRDALVKTSFSMGLWMVLLTSSLQLVVGDQHGLNTLHHQPAKLAAIEGHWETNHQEPMPLLLFAIPDMQQEKNHFELGVPYLGSLILTHEMNGVVTGLKDFPRDERPNALLVFWSFRIMVSMGMLMVLMSVLALWLRYRQRLYDSRGFLRFAMLMGASGYIALLAGWVTTEVGRQPWVVYGLLKTIDGLSHQVSAPQVGLSLTIFVVVYSIVFGSGFYYLFKLIRKGPQHQTLEHQEATGVGHFKTPMRPMSMLDAEDLDEEKKS